MSAQSTAERRIAAWLADEAARVQSEDLVASVIDATSRSRPLPRPVAVILEPGVRSPGGVSVGIPRRRLLVLAAVLALAVATVAGALLLLLQQVDARDTWSGYRGDSGRTGLGGHGPIGDPVTRWQVTAGGAITNAIAIADGLVIVPSDDGVLHALHIQDGTPSWTSRAATPVEALIGGSNVFTIDGDGRVRALDLQTGSILWTSQAIDPGPSDLAVLGSTLFFAVGTGELVALDTADGVVRWRVQVSPAQRGIQTPAAADGLVATVSLDNVVTVVDARNGSIVWQRADTSGEPLGPPVLADGTVYVGMAGEAETGRLIALSAADGIERWRLERDVYAPSVADGIGYAGSGVGHVAAIDLRTGSELWVAEYPGVVRAPAVSEHVIYIAADGARIVAALDRSTGAELWRVPVDGPNQCCIAIGDGLAVVGSATGTIEAIGGTGRTSGPRPTASRASPPTARPSSTDVPVATPLAELAPPPLLWRATSGASDFLPWAPAVSPDRTIWVAEDFGDRFSLFTLDGRPIETWGQAGSGRGQFLLTSPDGGPWGRIAFAPDGSFYVLDVGNFEVDRFGPDREYLGSFGGRGPGPRAFLAPVGIVVGPDGSVSVLDSTRSVIETYSPDGIVLATIPAWPPELGVNQGFNGFAVGPNGDYFLAVAYPNEVVELDAAGVPVRIFGMPGSGPGAFVDQPFAIAFDADGHVYVTQGLERADAPGVLVFNNQGSYLGGFGRSGGDGPDLAFPTGLVVDPAGIIVCDAGEAPDGQFAPMVKMFEPISFP